MGRARSKSTENEDADNSMEPNDGVSEPKSRSKSSTSGGLGRWIKFAAGSSGNKQWLNGCGDMPADGSSGGLDGHNPPILTIEVDTQQEVDLSHRVRQKTELQMSQEFASAARQAVQSQMKLLEAETSCVDGECEEAEIDGSARSLPPPNMNPTSLLESFGSAKVCVHCYSDYDYEYENHRLRLHVP